MSFDGQSARFLQGLTGHTSDVTSCDFAPNYVLVTGSGDKTIRIWEWNIGVGYKERPYSPLLGHKYGVTCVRVSPQGCMVASASIDGTAILWNIHSGTKIFNMTQVNGDAVRVCRFSPDSSVLATAGDNGAICIWDLVRRSLLRTILLHEGTTHSLAFTPDSQYLVSACTLEVLNIWSTQELVDTTNDEPATPVCNIDNVHDLGVLCIDVSNIVRYNDEEPLIKNYTMATSGNSNEIKIWTITSHTLPKHENLQDNLSVVLKDTYDGHGSAVTCVRFNNTGNLLLSSSLDKLVKIWNEDGYCVATLEGHKRYVNCVAFTKDSLIAASGSNDKSVSIWDISGELNIDSHMGKHQTENGEDVREDRVLRFAESNNNDVELLEKLDDISDGAINSCSFFGIDLLATGSGDKLVKLFKIVGENNNIEELACSPLESHTYSINHVEFSSDGSMLASCSLDGGAIIWNPETGEKIQSLPKNSLGIKVCRFSPNSSLLITAGDDEKAWIWDVQKATVVATLDNHLDAVTCAGFTPDGNLITTTSNNANFLLWRMDSYNKVYVQDDAHDLGIQSCDFSPNLEPVPNLGTCDIQSYLLATCGNDSFVKLWNVSLPKTDNSFDYDGIEVKLWRTLKGHGGNVICVRFSPSIGEIVCSTATDRQARIWSVYSAECLFVLDHDSIATSCSFNADTSLIAVGCIAKTVSVWKLPQQLVFQTAVASKIKRRKKPVIDWNTRDVLQWLKDIDFTNVSEYVVNTSLTGQKLLTLPEQQICSAFDLDEEQSVRLSVELKWLKQGDMQLQLLYSNENVEIPHEFLCPITHEIMREPVICSDGFTYEKQAIVEWFMSGKYTSPMTNEALTDTNYTSNCDLRNQIHRFVYDN